MAETVTIEAQPYVRRSPWVSWLLIFATLGVYYFVWFYKLHKEAKQYLQDDAIKPGLMTFSQFIPIWNWVTIYRFAEHIGATQRRAGAEETVEHRLAVCGVEAEHGCVGRDRVHSPYAKEMAFVHKSDRRGRLGARALLGLPLGRSLGNLDLKFYQELHHVSFAGPPSVTSAGRSRPARPPCRRRTRWASLRFGLSGGGGATRCASRARGGRPGRA